MKIVAVALGALIAFGLIGFVFWEVRQDQKAVSIAMDECYPHGVASVDTRGLGREIVCNDPAGGEGGTGVAD